MRGFTLFITVLLCAFFYWHSSKPTSSNLLDSQVAEQTARVLDVNDDQLTVIGSNKIGEQRLTLQLENDHVHSATNILTGAIEYDEYYHVGDNILVAVQYGDDNEIMTVRALSHYRVPYLVGLFVLFSALLLLYAKKVGLRALLSFTGSIIIIWKLLIPGLLMGISPILITSITLFALCTLIILSIAGWSYKGKAALAGSLVGLFVTTLLCLVSGYFLKLDGMTQPLAQALLFETGMHLNMLDVLYAAVLIGASGAAMDVAMEMAATMEELTITNPTLTRSQLLFSGFRVGSAVIGTMTTTLLLAYSGGFLTLLMLFISRDTSLWQIINMKLVASEIARTLIGSLSLVIVAPVTAWIASWMLYQEPKQSRLSMTVNGD